MAQGIIILLPSGVWDSSTVNVKLEAKQTTFHINILVCQQITNPICFLKFQKIPQYIEVMKSGQDLCMHTFHETMLSLHNSVGETMWREFHVSLDFPWTFLLLLI